MLFRLNRSTEKDKFVLELLNLPFSRSSPNTNGFHRKVTLQGLASGGAARNFFYRIPPEALQGSSREVSRIALQGLARGGVARNGSSEIPPCAVNSDWQCNENHWFS